jgi:hypothetical protein
MGDVYRNATITIAAIDSPGTEFGMLHDREVSPLCCRLDWISTNDEESTKVYLRSGSDFGDLNMKSSPLNTRGWALQEALLSPRTLSYGTQQMIWECQECRIDEGGRPVAPTQKFREKKFIQDLSSAKANSKRRAIIRRGAAMSLGTKYLNLWTVKFQKPYDRWYDIVREYTSRNLTVATDILPALSGLARAFQNLLSDKYCAGLWANDILRGLMWTRRQPEPEVTSRLLQQCKPRDYNVPSWSWASILGQMVTYVYPATDEYVFMEEQARVLELTTSPRSDDNFGQTKGGYLMIEGSYYDIQDPRIGTIENTFKSTPILQSTLHSVYNNTPHIEENFRQQHQEHDGQKFGLLLLTTYFTRRAYGLRTREGPIKYRNWPGFVSLIVETTGMLENEYRRVGLVVESYMVGDLTGSITNTSLFEEMKKTGKKKKIRLV